MLRAHDITAAIGAALEQGRALAVVSRLSSEAVPAPRLLVAEEGAIGGGSLGDERLDRAAARFAARLIAREVDDLAVAARADLLADADGDLPEGETRLLFELARPRPELIVCGGGHVGEAVARLAPLLDFAVTIIDDRAEFASRARFPDERIRLLSGDFVAALRSLAITRASHLVIVTRGHRHDEICLKEVIASPARYIGMIGSRRRTTTIREHLRREGVSPEFLHRVRAPIGLDIGALTPEEIALAILAEIVLVRRGGTGLPKSADGPMARAR